MPGKRCDKHTVCYTLDRPISEAVAMQLRNPVLRRWISALVAAVLVLGQASLAVQAAPVTTQSLLQAQQQHAERDRLMAQLEREAIAERLTEMGVSPIEVKQRVAALSDAEVAQLNDRIDELPAGGDVVGVIVLLFIVFVITDAVGATDFFTFVHPVR